MEFEMLEIRFSELADVVDVFLVLESNFTAYGTPKPLHLFNMIQNGSFDHILPKLVYVLLDFFPVEAHRDGWIAQRLLQDHIGLSGLPRLHGLRPDDLIALSDADEIPSRTALTFLKWHDGYSEPVSVRYKHYYFGFFWGTFARNEVEFDDVPSVVTAAMSNYVFRNKLDDIRRAVKSITKTFDIGVS